jgi:hypothetical protein
MGVRNQLSRMKKYITTTNEGKSIWEPHVYARLSSARKETKGTKGKLWETIKKLAGK